MLAKAAKVALAVLSIAHLSACSTTPGLIDYGKVDPSFKVVPGSLQGQAIGNLMSDEGGAVWDDCTEKAIESLKVLIAEAKAMGANAIGDIRWDASRNSTPACKKGWGYILLWPFLLTPLFMSTRVDATAYKITAPAKKAGIYEIPDDQAGQLALARKIVAGY